MTEYGNEQIRKSKSITLEKNSDNYRKIRIKLFMLLDIKYGYFFFFEDPI